MLDVALEVLESDGLEHLSLGEVARRLGIKTPSLYKHVEGKADLELGLVEQGFRRFTAEVESALGAVPDTADRRTRVAAYAAAYRGFALGHPQLYRLMNDRPIDRSRLAPGVETRAALALYRLLPDVDLGRSTWAWAHGLAMLEIAGRFPDGADIDAAWAVLVDVVTGA
ncbi:TetR/AcrR family transcriptional regulator [Salinibacterium soli]|uniref:TetR/AcrR family transcriptional regulator n=1 Tax=Antiquaquibacter soli TaxID=3064523 RepID=A0ABT9BJY6_9MICO|nr:TetR/AcrR family transcriptional regulator [Protaetiibacter sp. WY-16]MDO7880747.1 TetR/AcrR family transcriptional regulator [Protaetiibacter sp. WY-16]